MGKVGKEGQAPKPGGAPPLPMAKRAPPPPSDQEALEARMRAAGQSSLRAAKLPHSAPPPGQGVPAVSAVGPLDEGATRLIGGQEVITANARYPSLAAFAGSTQAKLVQRNIADGASAAPRDTIVEGPNAFSSDFQNGHDPLRELATKLWVKHTFDLSTIRHNRAWSRAITGQEVAALADQRDERGVPKLQPGDIIVNGIDRHEKDAHGHEIAVPHVGHVSMYVGKEKDGRPDASGDPTIIHCMATSTTDRSYLGHVLTVLKEDMVPGPADKTGVVKETVEGFFDRFPRENYAVLRLADPRLEEPAVLADLKKRGLSPEKMRDQGLKALNDALGQPYDMTLRKGPYCSWLVKAYQEAAYAGTGLAPPPIGTTWENDVRAWVVEPENVVAAPNAVVTAANGGGYDAVRSIVGRYVVAD